MITHCRKTQEDKENGKEQPKVDSGSESIISILVKKKADVNTALGNDIDIRSIHKGRPPDGRGGWHREVAQMYE